MKTTLKFTFLGFILPILILLSQSEISAQTPFTKGVNITGWLQVGSAKQIQFSKYNRQDFMDIKSLGCDVIRLPIDMTAMTNGSPDYSIDPLFYFILDSAVNWAEDLGLHLILDNHTMDPGKTLASIEPMLTKIWVQMAEHYKARSNLIYYELRNEPHDILTAVWAQIEINLINAIREIDTVHTIVVGASGWNTYSELKNLPVFADTNLIYTFHFYDPFLFTHQGATWPTPSLGSLAGVPFPYDAASMPSCPADLKGTWIEGSLATSYKADGTVAKVKQLIDQAVSFKNSRNVKIFCGEFGVYDLNSDTADRVFWYETVRSYLEEKGISWTIWDYHGGFGIFEKGGNGLFESDLNIPMVNALGLVAPEQIPFEIRPDTTGFKIYTDFIQGKLNEFTYVSAGSVDFYNSEYDHTGIYSIKVTGLNQYNNFGVDMVPDKDLSYLKNNKYFLEFYILGTGSATTNFDVRFLDTKTGPDDHPWRMRRTITTNMAPLDGQWHYVKLPLSGFTEHGSWDGSWFNPIGAFDWTAVDRLEIVAEGVALTGVTFWIDDISVTDTTIYTGTGKNHFISDERGSLQAWPNPVNSSTNISYKLESNGYVDLSIYSITGNKICSLVNRFQSAGNYTIPFPETDIFGNQLKAGIYICRYRTSESIQSLKLLVNP